MDTVRSIIFDYDGTLHNSIKIYAPAFRGAYEYLVSRGYAEERIWKDEEISKWLGYSSKDMWNNFMPNLPQEEKDNCSKIIGESMVKAINEGKAELYKGSIDILEYLRGKGFNLIFLSNCKIEYMNNHINKFKLEKYFHRFYCTEQYGFIPKYEIFDFIKKENRGEYLVIGDRFQDIEIAKINKLISIGCKYGYGHCEELKEADFLIEDIQDLKSLVK